MNIRSTSIKRVERRRYTVDRGVRISDSLILHSQDIFFYLFTKENVYVSLEDTGKNCELVDIKKQEALNRRSRVMSQRAKDALRTITFDGSGKSEKPIVKLVEWPSQLPKDSVQFANMPKVKSALLRSDEKTLISEYTKILPSIKRLLKDIIKGRPDEESIELKLVSRKNFIGFMFLVNLSSLGLANVKHKDFVNVTIGLRFDPAKRDPLFGGTQPIYVLDFCVEHSNNSLMDKIVRIKFAEDLYKVFKRVVTTLRKKMGLKTVDTVRYASFVSTIGTDNLFKVPHYHLYTMII